MRTSFCVSCPLCILSLQAVGGSQISIAHSDVDASKLEKHLWLDRIVDWGMGDATQGVVGIDDIDLSYDRAEARTRRQVERNKREELKEALLKEDALHIEHLKSELLVAIQSKELKEIEEARAIKEAQIRNQLITEAEEVLRKAQNQLDRLQCEGPNQIDDQPEREPEPPMESQKEPNQEIPEGEGGLEGQMRTNEDLSRPAQEVQVEPLREPEPEVASPIMQWFRRTMPVFLPPGRQVADASPPHESDLENGNSKGERIVDKGPSSRERSPFMTWLLGKVPVLNPHSSEKEAKGIPLWNIQKEKERVAPNLPPVVHGEQENEHEGPTGRSSPRVISEPVAPGSEDDAPQWWGDVKSAFVVTFPTGEKLTIPRSPTPVRPQSPDHNDKLHEVDGLPVGWGDVPLAVIAKYANGETVVIHRDSGMETSAQVSVPQVSTRGRGDAGRSTAKPEGAPLASPGFIRLPPDLNDEGRLRGIPECIEEDAATSVATWSPKSEGEPPCPVDIEALREPKVSASAASTPPMQTFYTPSKDPCIPSIGPPSLPSPPSASSLRPLALRLGDAEEATVCTPAEPFTEAQAAPLVDGGRGEMVEASSVAAPVFMAECCPAEPCSESLAVEVVESRRGGLTEESSPVAPAAAAAAATVSMAPPKQSFYKSIGVSRGPEGTVSLPAPFDASHLKAVPESVRNEEVDKEENLLEVQRAQLRHVNPRVRQDGQQQEEMESAAAGEKDPRFELLAKLAKPKKPVEPKELSVLGALPPSMRLKRPPLGSSMPPNDPSQGLWHLRPHGQGKPPVPGKPLDALESPGKRKSSRARSAPLPGEEEENGDSEGEEGRGAGFIARARGRLRRIAAPGALPLKEGNEIKGRTNFPPVDQFGEMKRHSSAPGRLTGNDRNSELMEKLALRRRQIEEAEKKCVFEPKFQAKRELVLQVIGNSSDSEYDSMIDF